MRQLIHLLLPTLAFVVSCTTEPAAQQQNPQAAPRPQAAPAVRPAPAEPARAQVLRFFITGDDAPGSFPTFIEAFFRRESDKNYNQVFFHPQNRGQFADPASRSYLSSDFSVSHELANFDDIARAMGESVKQQRPKRAILFLEGHGAFGGNFCYQTKHICAGTPAVFFAMLKVIDAKNKELKAEQRMEHLLLLPLSCYNMPLSQELFRLIATKADWSFHISDLHMVEHKPNTTGSCSADIFAGMMSFQGHVDDMNFKAWAVAGNTMELLTHLNTLENFVEVRNRIERQPRITNPLIFETANTANAPPASLKDFQLPVTLRVRQSNGAQQRFALAENPFPAGLSTGEFLDRFIPTELQPRVTHFRLADHAGQQQIIDVSARANKPDYAPVQTVEFDLDLTQK